MESFITYVLAGFVIVIAARAFLKSDDGEEF